MWYHNENGSSDKPSVLDTTTSKKYVYVRKEFNLIPAQDEDISEHWEWLEMKIKKEDWAVYQQVMDHDAALDDVYAALTELAELILEGE